MGIKLPGLLEDDGGGFEKLAAKYLSRYLCSNYIHEPIPTLITAFSRTYMIGGFVSDDFFFLDEGKQRDVETAYRNVLVQRVEFYRETFEPTTELAFLRIMADHDRLVDLAWTAAGFGLRASNVLDSFAVLGPSHLEQIVAHIRAAAQNTAMVCRVNTSIAPCSTRYSDSLSTRRHRRSRSDSGHASEDRAGEVRCFTPALRSSFVASRRRRSREVRRFLPRCLAYVKLWVEKRVRRHLMRARSRRGFGWKRWSTAWLHDRLGLYGDYRVRYWAAPESARSRSVT